MKRLHSLIILCLLTPGIAYALGLGNLQLKSALNEPFDGKIKLLSATVDELDSLQVELADSDAFARANIDRPFILSKLKFKLIRSETGENGRLYREYTVLLDPPMYDPSLNTAEIMALQPPTPEPVVTAPTDPDHQVVYAADFENYSGTASTAVAAAPASTINYSGGDYGPTTASDTLWSIASAMRPDTSISVNQMMLALLRANPDAFLNNNINGLKRGQILNMPSEAEMNALSSTEALAEVKGQYSSWDQIKGKLGTTVAERPESSSVPVSDTDGQADETATTASEEEASELRLVAAGEKSEATQEVTSVDGAVPAELVLAQENITALTQENLELKDQLKENESIINDLKRLLELKDDELAALQEQFGQPEMEAPLEEAAEEIEEAATVIEEVVEEPTVELTETVEEVVEITEEPVEEIAAPVAEVEETIEVIETEPETDTPGIMGMVETYLGPLTDMLGGNPLYAIAVVALLIVLILLAVVMKLKNKPSTEAASAVPAAAEEFPEFDTSDEDLDEAEQELDSEAATVLPGSEAETVLPGEEESFEPEDETYLPGGPDEAVETPVPAVEESATAEPGDEEEEEDPLQEVNTYLAFEQFDQAEEFVRKAISSKPDNPEYHSKLLEVFYTSGNKKAYEEEAKVLHELVDGEGEHWDMAVAMWSEMSPNRALFEEGAGEEEEEDETAETTGGFVDVTADAEAEDDNSLDFDIGASAEDESTLAESEEESLDISAADEGEDILDVTAAVGLEDTEAEAASDDDEMLDISGSSAGEDLLDVTAVGSSDEEELDEDVLDISNSGISGDDKLESTSAEDDNEDLLDVSAGSDLELDSNEDLLDVTAATAAGADSDELLDLDIEDTVADTAHDEGESGNVIDFDLASSADEEVEESTEELSPSLGEGAASIEESADFELDTGDASEVDEGLELDLGDSGESEEADEGLELDLSDTGAEQEQDADEPIRLDMDLEEEAKNDDIDNELTLDMALDDSTLQEAAVEPEKEDADTPSMDFDLSIDEGTEDTDAELGGTLEMEPPEIETEDDDDEGDHTVFVPRASQPDEQSAEDEIATKLDLAKAYVELGDKDSAKTILDEVLADGNDEQKQQAQDLMGQI